MFSYKLCKLKAIQTNINVQMGAVIYVMLGLNEYVNKSAR